MRRLSPCGVCRRHVADTEQACPFCRAALVPALLAAALALGGCNSSAKQEALRIEQARREAELGERAKAADASGPAARRPRAVYGAPPKRDRDGSKQCDCPPNDPLCSCL